MSIMLLYYTQDIILPQWLPRSILTLEQDRSRFQRAEGVPLAGGDVDEGAAGEHVDGFGQPPLLIIEVFFEMPAEADYRLGGGPVPMDGQDRAGLDGVQHALGAIGRRVPQIVIHP